MSLSEEPEEALPVQDTPATGSHPDTPPPPGHGQAVSECAGGDYPAGGPLDRRHGSTVYRNITGPAHPDIAEIDLGHPLVANLAAALDEVDEVYLRDAIYVHHPRYLAHLTFRAVSSE